MDKTTRPCPFCGEQIKSDALKCRYCREWLTAPGITPPTAANPQAIPQAIPVTAPEPEAKLLEASPATYVAPAVKLFAETPASCCDYRAATPPGSGNPFLLKLKYFYRNSYLIFFILTFILVSSVDFFKSTFDISLPAQYSFEFYVHFLWAQFAFATPKMMAFAIMVACGMVFAAIRNDKAKLSALLLNLLPVLIIFSGALALYFRFAPPEKILTQVTDHDLFFRMMTFHAIDFFFYAVSGILIAALLARGHFGKLLACFMPYIVVISLEIIVMILRIHPDWSLNWIVTVFLGQRILVTILLAVFCYDLLFKKFRFCREWLLYIKIAGSAVCIFAALFWGNYFYTAGSAYAALLNVEICYTMSLICGFVGSVASGILLAPTIWAGRINEPGQQLAFYLKTLLIAMPGVLLIVLLLLGSGVMTSDPAITMLIHDEFLLKALIIAALLTLKAVSNAYYCSCKWFFMLPSNMLLTLCGCAAFWSFILPGDNPEGLAVLAELGLPVTYSTLFLLLSFAFDIFALFHAIYSRTKPLYLNRIVYIVCSVLAALVMIFGFFALKY